jgi:hypothetical protein
MVRPLANFDSGAHQSGPVKRATTSVVADGRFEGALCNFWSAVSNPGG